MEALAGDSTVCFAEPLSTRKPVLAYQLPLPLYRALALQLCSAGKVAGRETCPTSVL